MSLTLFGYTIAPIDPIRALLLLVALFVFVPAGAWFATGRARRSLEAPEAESPGMRWARNAPRPDPEVAAYLARVERELRLPAGLAAEVCAELENHLTDSIEAIESEGLSRDRAVREALARLGSPTELGRLLRAAQQTRRRLLAGAAGGAFALGGAFIWASIRAMIVLFVVAIAALLVVGVLAAGGAGPGPMDPGLQFVMTVAFDVAAFAAGRSAVDTVAGISCRQPSGVALPCAILVAPIALAFALFVPSGEQTWVSAAAALAMPLAASAGAMQSRLPSAVLRAPRRARALAQVVGVSAVAIVLVGMSYGRPVPSPTALSALPPLADLSDLPRDVNVGGHCWGYEPPLGSCTFWVSPFLNKPGEWRNARIEVWRGVYDGRDSVGLDATARSPILVVQTAPDPVYGREFSANFVLGIRRDGPAWWAVLTATAHDGRRYRLSDGAGFVVKFNGTVWQWLTAPG